MAVRGGTGSPTVNLDHLVYGTPHLEATVGELEARLGVRPAAGGQHPGKGTRNALLRLGDAAYLEVLGPDPDQPPPDGPRWLGIDELDGARLVAWAVRCDDLDALAARARRSGLPVGPVESGRRRRADGLILSWRLTDPDAAPRDATLPFLIDWGESDHPASSAPGGVSLVDLHAVHPEPEGLRAGLLQLGVDLPVQEGRPGLLARLAGPEGIVELGSRRGRRPRRD